MDVSHPYHGIVPRRRAFRKVRSAAKPGSAFTPSQGEAHRGCGHPPRAIPPRACSALSRRGTGPSRSRRSLRRAHPIASVPSSPFARSRMHVTKAGIRARRRPPCEPGPLQTRSGGPGLLGPGVKGQTSVALDRISDERTPPVAHRCHPQHPRCASPWLGVTALRERALGRQDRLRGERRESVQQGLRQVASFRFSTESSAVGNRSRSAGGDDRLRPRF